MSTPRNQLRRVTVTPPTVPRSPDSPAAMSVCSEDGPARKLFSPGADAVAEGALKLASGAQNLANKDTDGFYDTMGDPYDPYR